MVKFNQRLSML